jgi:hypothetical protein
VELAPVAEPAVGALFDGDGHFCSGSVVHSPAGNEVITAAHCIHEGSGGDYLSDLTFAPGYHDGTAPYGMWSVTSTLVAPGWIDDSDPDLDVGFVTVRQDGNPSSIESVTGANQFGIACDGFPDGTSGGPWVVGAAPDTSLGTVVGVIGGYQLGGDEEDVSYSSYFDTDIEKLYRASTSETH